MIDDIETTKLVDIDTLLTPEGQAVIAAYKTALALVEALPANSQRAMAHYQATRVVHARGVRAGEGCLSDTDAMKPQVSA